jgi:hypothetical protein
MNNRLAPSAEALAAGAGTLRVHFDASCGAALRRILIDGRSADGYALFVETDPMVANVVIFGSDEIDYIGRNTLYRSHKAKSICITESDIPTFRIPGLYAANMKSPITSSRTRTMSYFISEQERGNQEVRRLIGEPVEKRYLYSFMGGSNSWARKWLFKAIKSQSDTLVEPTDSYNHWNATASEAEARAKQRRRYAEVMAASKFSLCPRGCGLSSYRLFESMSLGVAPVIISDKWRPIEDVDWSFALFVPERSIPQIDQIVRAHASEWQERGQAGQAIYTSILAPHVVARMLHRKIADVAAGYDPTREAAMAMITPARAAIREAYWSAYKLGKYAALWGFRITGRPVPIRLNRPVDVQLNRARPGGLG